MHEFFCIHVNMCACWRMCVSETVRNCERRNRRNKLYGTVLVCARMSVQAKSVRCAKWMWNQWVCFVMNQASTYVRALFSVRVPFFKYTYNKRSCLSGAIFAHVNETYTYRPNKRNNTMHIGSEGNIVAFTYNQQAQQSTCQFAWISGFFFIIFFSSIASRVLPVRTIYNHFSIFTFLLVGTRCKENESFVNILTIKMNV